MTQLFEVVTGTSNMKVDRENGVIHDVLILGHKSRNGRSYLPKALQAAVPMYESRVVNVGHPPRSEPSKERTFDDRFGWLENVKQSSDGLRGDLHYLKADSRAEKFCEAAERNPAMFGLSHNAEGRTVKRGNEFLVEEIEQVRSVDIVSDPATTRSLFESMDSERNSEMDDPAMAPEVSGGGDVTLTMFQQKVAEIYNGDGDPASKAKAIGALAKTLLKIKDDLDAATSKQADAAAAKASVDSSAATAPTMESLQAQVKTLTAEKEVRDLLESAKVAATPIQIKAVMALESTDDRKALIESYKTLNKDERPKSASPLMESRDDKAKEPPKDSTEFAQQLKRNR
jgi:hypothetical protein